MKLESFFNIVKKTIDKYRLINPKDNLLLMCSGGPDSTFLLFLFNYIKFFYNINFAVFHLDHKIRKDSYLEKELLIDYCSNFNIDFYHFEEDVLDLAKKNKRNLEEMARILRYNLAYKVAMQNNFNKLVTAHHFDDFISSFFINLFKKNHYINLFNLRPMGYWKDLPLIRPLLFITKKKILEYLKQNNIHYIIDHTNFDMKLLRNRINKEITSQLVRYLSKLNTMELFDNTFNFSYSYLDSIKKITKVEYQKQKLYKLTVLINDEFLLVESLYFNIRNLINENVKYNVVKKLLSSDCVSIKKNWKVKRIEQNVFFLYWDPYKIEEKIIRDLEQGKEFFFLLDDLSFKMRILKKVCLKELSSVFNNEVLQRINNDKGYFLGLFYGFIRIRSRKEGDFFLPFGLGGKKQKIKKFFIDRKIQEFLKDRCIIFEDELGIAMVWCYQRNVKRSRELTENLEYWLVEIIIS